MRIITSYTKLGWTQPDGHLLHVTVLSSQALGINSWYTRRGQSCMPDISVLATELAEITTGRVIIEHKSSRMEIEGEDPI